jgi:hypothetical protein
MPESNVADPREPLWRRVLRKCLHVLIAAVIVFAVSEVLQQLPDEAQAKHLDSIQAEFEAAVAAFQPWQLFRLYKEALSGKPPPPPRRLAFPPPYQLYPFDHPPLELKPSRDLPVMEPNSVERFLERLRDSEEGKPPDRIPERLSDVLEKSKSPSPLAAPVEQSQGNQNSPDRLSGREEIKAHDLFPELQHWNRRLYPVPTTWDWTNWLLPVKAVIALADVVYSVLLAWSWTASVTLLVQLSLGLLTTLALMALLATAPPAGVTAAERPQRKLDERAWLALIVILGGVVLGSLESMLLRQIMILATEAGRVLTGYLPTATRAYHRLEALFCAVPVMGYCGFGLTKVLVEMKLHATVERVAERTASRIVG